MDDRAAGRVVIIGAGPAGLGAAWRLMQKGYDDFLVVEGGDRPGGLSASYTDDRGFTWDIGGHVLFSHYGYFDRLMDELLGDAWFVHERESWIRAYDRFVPYPFQYNIHRLPREQRDDCLRGAIRAAVSGEKERPADFREWILSSFGEGIAGCFLLPYNFKTWAWPPETMDYSWVGERVATVDIERLVFNVLYERDDVSWGPNSTFRFPRSGGTGAIWKSLAARLPRESLLYGTSVIRLDSSKRRLFLSDGSTIDYDTLVSTMPLDRLVACSDLDDIKDEAQKLVHSSVNVVGVGLDGTVPPHLDGKCWMYFPGGECPFYRATVFSHYSPCNVPDPDRQWSLMLEVSESPAKPVDASGLEESVLHGLVATGLIGGTHEVVDMWTWRAEYGYPTPFLGRDAVLDKIMPRLERAAIYSRGRFGAWKYEVANQDHSLMQGVELVDRLLDGTDEETLKNPAKVNAGGASGR